mgnify:CR=1 FL=1
MNNTQHTPGPWSAHYNNEGLTVFSPDNVTVAYVDYDECEERPVEANAHLIAAAPAMYEALKGMVSMYDSLNKSNKHDGACPCYHCQARAALAQAEGSKP